MLKFTSSTGAGGAGRGVSAQFLLIASVGLLAAAAILSSVRRRVARAHEFARADQRVDKGLKDSFPASDPPAPHYVDIPVNRR